MRPNFKNRKGIMPILFVAIFLAVSAIVMLLWNATLPEITGVKIINYWQAMGIIILSRILFGNFKKPDRPPFMENRFKENFFNMSPDEKRALQNKWKEFKQKQ